MFYVDTADRLFYYWITPDVTCLGDWDKLQAVDVCTGSVRNGRMEGCGICLDFSDTLELNLEPYILLSRMLWKDQSNKKSVSKLMAADLFNGCIVTYASKSFFIISKTKRYKPILRANIQHKIDFGHFNLDVYSLDCKTINNEC